MFPLLCFRYLINQSGQSSQLPHQDQRIDPIRNLRPFQRLHVYEHRLVILIHDILLVVPRISSLMALKQQIHQFLLLQELFALQWQELLQNLSQSRYLQEYRIFVG